MPPARKYSWQRRSEGIMNGKRRYELSRPERQRSGWLIITATALLLHLALFFFLKPDYLEIFRKEPPGDEGLSSFKLVDVQPSSQPFLYDLPVFTEEDAAAEKAEEETTEKSMFDELGEPSLDVEPLQKGGRTGGGGGSPGPRSGFVEPRPLSMPWPKFPDGVDRDITGRVELLLFVNERGEVMEIKVAQGLRDKRLNSSAIEAAREIRFIPGEIKGVPTSMWVRLTIGFQPR